MFCATAILLFNILEVWIDIAIIDELAVLARAGQY